MSGESGVWRMKSGKEVSTCQLIGAASNTKLLSGWLPPSRVHTLGKHILCVVLVVK